MASRLDDQLLQLRLRLLQEKLSAIQKDTARSRSRPPSSGGGSLSTAVRLQLENAQRRRNELERRLQEERLARERALARPPPAPQFVPLMLPPVDSGSKRSPDYMELMMMQNAQLNQLVTSQLMMSLMRPPQPPPRTPSSSRRRSPYEAPASSIPLVPPLRGLEDASTSRLMAYFEKEYRAAGAFSARAALPVSSHAGLPPAHPLATGRHRARRGGLRSDPGVSKRFSDHIERVD